MKRNVIALFVTLILLCAVGADATDYYVKNGGNDNLSGTSDANAWATFTNVVNGTFYPGDNIYLKRGSSWNEFFWFDDSGNSTNYITIGAYGTGNRPIIQRASKTADVCMNFNAVSYLNVRDIEFGTAHSGILLWRDSGTSTFIYIEDCYFKNIDDVDYVNYGWATGITAWGNGSFDNLYIDRCTFDHCTIGIQMASVATYNFYSADCEAFGGADAGLWLTHTTGGIVSGWKIHDIAGNIAVGNAGAGMLDCHNMTFEDCDIWNIQRVSCPDGVGFDFEGANSSIYFSNNRIFNCYGAGIMVMSTTGHNSDITIDGCLLYNNARSPYNSASQYELLCWNNGSTGTVSNCRVYKANATSHFSTLWDNFTKTNNTLSTYDPTWIPVFGTMGHISVGNSSNIRGCLNGSVLKWNGYSWDSIPNSAMAEVEVASDGCVVAVGTGSFANQAYYWSGAGWVYMNSSTTQWITTGSTGATYQIATTGTTWVWNGSGWTSVASTPLMTMIDRASDGTMVALKTDGKPYYWTGSAWSALGTQTLTYITTGSASNTWGVNGTSVYKWNGSSWSFISGSMSKVSAGSDGTVWGINSLGHLFKRP